MFFTQYADPSDELIMVGIIGWGAWLVTLLIHGIVRLVMFLRYRAAQAREEVESLS